MENIFTHWAFTDFVLPWVLVFVLIFAILEKSQLLGEGKKQINAIIGAVCGLLLLAFPVSRGVVVNLIPLLAIIAVIIFVFMLLYGFVSGEVKGDPLGKGVKVAIGIGIAIALAIAVLVFTGSWDKLWNYLSSSNTGSNIIFILLAVGAVLVVLLTGKKKSD